MGALSGADSLARGGAPEQAKADALLGGTIGGAFPLAGKAIEKAGGLIFDHAVRPVATMLNRENEAVRRVGRAVDMDRAGGKVIGEAEEAALNSSGAPVLNADRFGSAIRSLARTAVNVSPEAENALRDTVQDRFFTQGARAKGFVSQLMGGATDDLTLQDAFKVAADRANSA